MKKVIFVALAFFFTSCIEIIQEINLKKNGSGSAVYTIDMSKMKDMMDALSAFSSDKEKNNSNEFKANDLDEQFQQSVQKLKQIQGISKVELTSDKNLLYKIKFRFKDLEALNKALTLLHKGDSAASETPTIEYVKQEGKQFIIKNYDILKNSNKLSPNSKPEKEEGMGDVVLQENDTEKDTSSITKTIEGFFKDAKYTMKVRFYSNVLSASHPQSQINKKQVTLIIPMLDLDKPENAQNIVTLK